MQIDNSWEFLYDFFMDDPSSIAELINKTLGVESKKRVRTDSWNVFFEDIICSLSKNSGDKTTYLDFLTYVKGKDVGTIDDPCTENQEFYFIDKLWSKISAKSSVSALVSKRFITTGIPHLLLPYLILYSLDIKKDWFLYGGNSESYIVDVDGKDDNKKKLRKVYDTLKKGFKKLQNLYYKLKIIIYRFRREKLSSESLYPLMTLLIVLRREWKLSKSEEYVKLKKESLSNFPIKTNDTKINALIFGLYKHYKDADEDIMNDIEKKHCEIPTIEIHPLVAKHIIESKSFKPLFNPDIKLSKTGIGNGEDIMEYYRYIEQKLGNNYSGKRLLVDYLFPITEIRENDVFVPSSDSQLKLIDQIYLSLILGKDYKNYWREPQEGELFDWIQLLPPVKLSDADSSVIGYRGNLKPSGDFLFVWSKENDTIKDKLKEAFSDFRHDLKDLREASAYPKDLKKKLNDIIQYSRVIYKTIEDVNVFFKDPSDLSSLNVIRKSLERLDNDKDLQRFINNPNYEYKVFAIRDSIEKYYDTKSIESLKIVPNHLIDLRPMLVEAFSNSLSGCIDKADFIEDSYSTLCDYINIAGVDEFEKNDDVELGIFLKDFIKHATLNAKRAKLSLDFNVDKECIIKSNKAILKVIINSIVDNAYTHGFCDTPQIIDPKIIKFVLEECGDYLLLKICNNGHPIKVTENEYKTRGVFRGPTGHTGLGGYLISKYAEQLGGYVKIPKEEEREWNTEIHLYLKK